MLSIAIDLRKTYFGGFCFGRKRTDLVDNNRAKVLSVEFGFKNSNL